MTTDSSLPPGALGPPDFGPAAADLELPEPRRGKGERTRRKLLEGAELVFGAVGYHDASIVKITEAADVAQGTFYLYFASKRQIFDEVVADLNQRVRRAMSEAARGATSRLEAERLGFAGFFRFTSQHPALYRVIRQAEFVSPQALRNHYETILGHYAPFLEEAMGTGEVVPGDPLVLAWALAAVGEAVGLRWILWNEDQEIPPEVFEEMMAIIARMLGASAPGVSAPAATRATGPGGDPFVVGRWVTDRASLDPLKAAIVFEDRVVTYRELDDASNAMCGALLARGLVLGDRVGVLSENRPEQVALLFACAKAGLVMFPMNWRLTNPELAEQLSLIEPALWMVSAAQRTRVDSTLTAVAGDALDLERFYEERGSESALGESPVVTGDDGLMVIATSGTTGRAKGVLLTHTNFFWTNLSLDQVAPITSRDTVLQVLPQFHIGGWNVQPMLAWWKGATVILESTFDPGRVLELVARHRVSTMAGVPATYLMIGQQPQFVAADLSSLRFGVVGGAAMPLSVFEQWRSKGVAIHQGYGLTEAAPNVFCLGADDAPTHPGSVGHPYPYVEVALRDEGDDSFVVGAGQGELWVRGPAVFKGYWRDPVATRDVMKEGWLRTGDVVAREDDGFYRVVGRSKEMFVSGGENVYPVEVENVITAFAGVVSAAVVRVAHGTWGEVGVAFVEQAPGGTLDVASLEEHCRARLASYKIPVRFVVVDVLPRSPVGKIDKLTLRAMAEGVADLSD